MAVSTRRPRFGALSLLAAVVAVAVAGQARAEEAETVSPDKLVALRLEWHTQQARQEVADDEVRRLVPRTGTAGVRNFQDPGVVLNQLRKHLEDDYRSLRNASHKIAEAARGKREEARKEWEEVYRQRIAFRQYTDQQQAIYKFDFDTGAQPAFKPEIFDAVVVAWAALMFVIAVRLSRHARRVAIRQAERVAAAVLLVSLFTASGCSSGPAPDGRPWAVREEAKLAAENKEAKEKADAAAAEASARWNKTLDGWAGLVTVPPGTAGEQVEGILRDGENDAHKHIQEAAEASRLADRLTTEAAAEREQLAADKNRLSELTTGAKLRAIAYTSVRCAFVAVLFGLAVSPYWRARRGQAAQVRSDAKKCPRCFSEKLVVETSGAPPGTEDDEAPRKRNRGAKVKKPKARVEDEEPAETGYVECRSCSFRFLRSYQKVPRLCFPVVGVRSSGKTHMLATGYDRVRKRVAPTVAVVQPAPSLGDLRFEQYIDLILNLKQQAGATVHDMPDPVMLHIRDADPAGPNTALVNLFDYAGEMLNQSIDRDRLKKQAVKMDGFMLFLDPTQLYGDMSNLTLDRQLAALNEFMADMREARKVQVGAVIQVPVAVVIPKFDLLLTENPIQGQCVPFIRRMLAEMNPPPKQTTLGTIQGRSELVEQMLELMFRGVDIRGLVESYFGSQVMFFPVSSVSLFENELGVKDLSKRTIAPFGVAEPFLWLLHMHGYEMFA
ncbi:MAG: hypothetical protein J0I06_02500 [Planctomycetes bacterium]|nr:hypothetical protein [Planctomycetota bacterium]